MCVHVWGRQYDMEEKTRWLVEHCKLLRQGGRGKKKGKYKEILHFYPVYKNLLHTEEESFELRVLTCKLILVGLTLFT